MLTKGIIKSKKVTKFMRSISGGQSTSQQPQKGLQSSNSQNSFLTRSNLMGTKDNTVKNKNIESSVPLLKSMTNYHAS